MIRRLLNKSSQATTQIPPSPFTQWFFFDTRLAWIWLIIRFLVGYQWFTSGWAKLTGYSIAIGSFGQAVPGGSWLTTELPGSALAGFIQGALTKTGGPFPSVQSWYAVFLQYAILPHTNIFVYVVTFGEIFVGLGILVGAFTGIAAFFGLFMNVNYLLAGSLSINLPLAIGALFLFLAWRVSGYYGLDRYLIPWLGTPWTGPLSPLPDESLPSTVSS